jgi:hypothetical protein
VDEAVDELEIEDGFGDPVLECSVLIGLRGARPRDTLGDRVVTADPDECGLRKYAPDHGKIFGVVLTGMSPEQKQKVFENST